jgi:hypothetical protein
MEAVWLALVQFESWLSHKTVLLMTDNTTVMWYVRKEGGARSDSLSQKVEQILLWCQTKGIVLLAQHIAGTCNVLADALSRSDKILNTEWTLSERALAPLWTAWFKPMVDLFATRFNARLPLYVSPVADPDAWRVDALSIDWSGLEAYAFPPVPLLRKVLRKARLERPRLILVAPFWPAQTWFPELMELGGQPIPLSLRKGDLFQPRSRVPHGNPLVLNLHAWRLCNEH